MKWLLSSILFFSVNAFAAETPAKKQFSFKVRVPAALLSCSAQAEEMGQRFHEATGLVVVKSECVGQVQAEFDREKYNLNTIAVSYLADSNFNPYVAMIGEQNLFSPIEAEQTVYAKYADCLADQEKQNGFFKVQTGLTLVANSCEAAGTSYRAYYVMKLFGFDKNLTAKPKKRLFTYVPSLVGSLEQAKHDQLVALMSTKGATIVAAGRDSFSYYAETPVSIKSTVFSFFNESAQCDSQLDQAQNILQKANAKNTILWCEARDVAHSFVMQAIHDGSEVSDDAGTFSTQYYSFAECMKDRDYVLNDGRHTRALGGLCMPSTQRDGEFLLQLFSKLY